MTDFPLPPWFLQSGMRWMDEVYRNTRQLIESYGGAIEEPERNRFRLISFGVLRLNDALQVTFVNPAAQRLLGEKAVIGAAFADLLPASAAELVPRLNETLLAGKPFNADIELPNPAAVDLPIPVDLNIVPYWNPIGVPFGYLVILNRLARANLRILRKLRAQLLVSCQRDRPARELLREVLQALRSIIPYDVATYYEHDYDDAGAADAPSPIRRARFTLDVENADHRWSRRWWPVPPSAELSSAEAPIIDDLEAILAGLSENQDELRRHPSVVEAQQARLRSFLYFPLTEYNSVVSAISFASRQPGRFCPDHREALSAVGLQEVLEFIRVSFRRSRQECVRGIGELFHSRAAPAVIAEHFVRQIAQEFEWDYVGIFRVARSLGKFQLVAQYDASQLLGLPHNYTQPLDNGVLGSVLREKYPIRIADVDVDPPPFGYVKLSPAHKSCLCFPVFVGTEIEWVLDCESTQFAAFAGPDERELRALIGNLQTTLELWFETQLSRTLLERIQQGVIVADELGRIQRCNEAARRLLGVSTGEWEGKELAGFAADEFARGVFSRERDASERRVRLKCADGIERSALVSAQHSAEAFNRWIWLFTNLTEQSWPANLAYVRSLAQEVAQQTRGPLMLAHALLNRVGDLLQSGELPGDAARYLERASRNITKADITYERLAQDLRIRQAGRGGAFDVAALLRSFHEQLPQEDRDALVLRLPDDAPRAVGQPERVAAALRSLLGHLLDAREPAAKVECALCAADRLLTLRLSTTAIEQYGEREARDAIEAWEQNAREAASVGYEAAEAIFRRAGGSLKRSGSAPALTFTATLPMAGVEAENAS